MGKLFYVIGKSATGKDTIFQKLLENESLALKPLVLYTTRPMRAGEEQGVQYHFTDEAGLTELQNAGKVIELRYMECGNILQLIQRRPIWKNITMRASAYWSPTGHFGIIMGQSE